MRRWWNGLRVTTRIARRDAARSRGRTALVAAMIGLPVLLGVGGGVLISSMQPTNATFARWALGDEAQALVVSVNDGPGLTQDARAASYGTAASEPSAAAVEPVSTLDAYEHALTAALPAGDMLVPVVTGEARIATDDAHVAAGMVEYPAASLASLQTAELVRGALPTKAGEVALATGVAHDLRVTVGDTVRITALRGDGTSSTTSAAVRVTAIVATRNPYLYEGVAAPTGTLLPPVPDTLDVSSGAAPAGDDRPQVHPSWFVTGAAPVTWSDVQRVNAVGSRIVSREVVEHPQVVPTVNAGSSSAGTAVLVAAVVAMALIEAVLLIGPAFAVGARRSERQLALVAAAGGERRTLRRIVLASGLVIGLGSSALAAALGLCGALAIRAWTLSRHWSQFPDLRVPWYVIPGALALGTGLAVAAAWVPARRAARVDVAAALAGRRAEARPRRAVPVVGVVLFVLGGLAAAFGASRSMVMVLVGGMLVLELGMVAASGGLVALVSRLAPLAGVAGRFALRDAERQRGRTAPAVAAVIAAIAGVTAGAMYTASQAVHDHESYAAPVAAGSVVVDSEPQMGPDATTPPPPVTLADVEGAVAALRDAGLPVAHAYPARLARPHFDSADVDVEALSVPAVEAVRPAAAQCPVTGDETPAQTRRLSADPRCTAMSFGSWVMWQDSLTYSQVVVDDGPLVAHSGVSGASAAAAALAAGKVVVGSPYLVWPDGTAHLEIATGSDDAPTRTVTVPAVAVDGHGLWDTGPVLPSVVAQRIGLDVTYAGALVTLRSTPTTAQLSTVQDATTTVRWQILHDDRDDSSLVLLILVAAALIAGLGSTGIAVALAGTESRLDLATLGAVGASPSVRRRVSAAQAGVISILGVALGVLTGLALGYVLIVAQRYRSEWYDPFWHVRLPWPALGAVAIGVPVLAMGAAALFIRSRLPVVSRVVG